MRAEILIVNPNTNQAVTAWLAEEARMVVGAGFDIVAVNADTGLAALETPHDIEIAAQAVADCVANRPSAAGALIGAFGDPGLAAASALGAMPVSGLGEAGLRAAALNGRSFSLVTLGAAMRAPILAKASALGVSCQLAEILILPFSVAEIVADRAGRRADIAAALHACKGEAVLLGGAPFAGMARALALETGRVVLDGVSAAVSALTR